MARALKYVVQLLVVGAIYFFLVRFGLELASIYPGAALIWPPAAFALAAVLLGGYRVVPAIFAAAYLAYAAWSDQPYAVAAIAAGNALEALAGGFLVNWWAGGRNAFAEPTGIAKFVLIAIFAAAISASIGSGVKLGLEAWSGLEQVDWEKFAAVWFPWWLGDLAALLMITPPLILWVTDFPRSFELRSVLELTAIFAAAGCIWSARLRPVDGRYPERGAACRSCGAAADMGGVAPRSARYRHCGTHPLWLRGLGDRRCRQSVGRQRARGVLDSCPRYS